MRCGIYMITCKESKKVYIGQSKDVKKRFKHHIYNLKNERHANQHMIRSFKKYGKDAFEFTIIEICSEENLNEKEENWINYYDSRNPEKGFNKVIGPYRGKGIKEYNSIEFKKMMSELQKEKWKDKEYKEKCIKSIQQAHQERKEKGIPLAIHSEESKKKSRKSCSTPEFLKGLSERRYQQLKDPKNFELTLKNLEKGRNNPSIKKSMSDAKKRNWQDPVFREMIMMKQREGKERKKVEKYLVK